MTLSTDVIAGDTVKTDDCRRGYGWSIRRSACPSGRSECVGVAAPSDPTDGSLYHPAYLTQVTAVFAVAVSNVRLDPQPAKYASSGFAVIARIGVQLFSGCAAWTPRLATDGRIFDHRRQNLLVVAAIGRGRANHQGDTVTVDQQRVFCPLFAAIHRAGAAAIARPPRGADVVESMMTVSRCNWFS